MAIDIETRRKLPSHHGGTTRRAYTTGDREALKVGAFDRQAVDVRRLDIRMAMTTQVAPAPVISKDEKYIRLRARRSDA